MKTLKGFFTGRSNNVTNELTFQKSENKKVQMNMNINMMDMGTATMVAAK